MHMYTKILLQTYLLLLILNTVWHTLLGKKRRKKSFSGFLTNIPFKNQLTDPGGLSLLLL